MNYFFLIALASLISCSSIKQPDSSQRGPASEPVAFATCDSIILFSTHGDVIPEVSAVTVKGKTKEVILSGRQFDSDVSENHHVRVGSKILLVELESQGDVYRYYYLNSKVYNKLDGHFNYSSLKKDILSEGLCTKPSSFSSSDEGLSECQTLLMSEPNCVDYANATSFCETMGSTPKVAESAARCLKSMGGTSSNNIAMCLAGFVKTSNQSDKRTLCDKK